MTIVLVHGNPETAAIWDDLRTHLGPVESVTLSPPGFGAAVPDHFAATADDYVAWLADALRDVPSPIDLVGHDWGGGHVVGLVRAQPQLVRSWVTDIAGCFDPEYVWHDLAQVWQTPGAGEEAIERQLGLSAEQRAAAYQQLGMSAAAAESCARAFTLDMGRCILALYRSAAQPRMREWGADLSSLRSRPGLVIVATEDHYTGGARLARRTAERAGAGVTVLEGLGHWWMCQDPARGAEALRTFVESLPRA
ncbi:MAG: alpha/beta hydrolase [Chloroflexi bacterium]|nr:alpha/beta hydrolase [Chloroflexota bacterium]